MEVPNNSGDGSMSKGSVNKVILIGNLGRDPDIRYTASGAAVANIRIATSESWRDKQTGDQQERTEWHTVVLFNKLGEIAGEYLRKGSKVYIEGKLQTRKWQDQNGQDRYTTEVVANEMQMLDSRSGGSMSMESEAAPSSPPRSRGAPSRSSDDFQGSSSAPPSSQGGGGNPGGFDNDFDDDIPF